MNIIIIGNPGHGDTDSVKQMIEKHGIENVLVIDNLKELVETQTPFIAPSKKMIIKTHEQFRKDIEVKKSEPHKHPFAKFIEKRRKR